jgi:hypothetical protein
MSIESKELQDFIKKCVSPNLKHFKDSKFSKTSEMFIEKIFENIRLGELQYNKTNFFSRDIDNNYSPKGIHFHLCPDSMKKYIETMKSIGSFFSFSINNREINVYLIYENENKKKNRNDWDKYFENAKKKIYIIVYLLQIYSKKKCSQKLTLYLYLTNIKKTLDECNINNEICTITQNNANSAFTFACIKINEVYIYRKEEWFKVLTHELIHSFGLEFSGYDTREIDKKVYREIFPIETDLRLFESYTETWGEILNIIIIVHLSMKDGEPIKKGIKKTELLLQKERMFSMFQASKILCHFGLTYNNMFERNEEGYNNRHLYKESTPVLSYFIIKNILMFYSNEFLEWCIDSNGYSLDFKKTTDIILKENIYEFIKFIKQYHNRDEFILSMNEMRSWFFKKDNVCNKNDAFIKTLRMSLLEY